MKRIPRTAWLLILAILITGCEGAEGPAGPVGPQGEQGPPGNANVQSFTITLATADFTASGPSLEAASYTAPQLTQAVVDGGAVLAFTDIGSGADAWIALPFIAASVNMTYVVTAGALGIFLSRPSGAPRVASLFNGFRVRVLVIPPAQAARLSGVDVSNYEAVRSAMGF